MLPDISAGQKSVPAVTSCNCNLSSCVYVSGVGVVVDSECPEWNIGGQPRSVLDAAANMWDDSDSDDQNEQCAHLYQSTSHRHCTMYGMLLESVQFFIQELHGEQGWNRILEYANIKNMVFTTHKRYNNTIMTDLASACAATMGDKTQEEYMCFFGKCFVEYFTHYGYDTIMRVSGRHYRDFLNGIDNLHETMRFSYPKMLSPSFYVTDEHRKGCLLHYRSKRLGFKQYVVGQLKQCGKRFYNVDVEVTVVKETISEQGCHVIFELVFDNYAYKSPEGARSQQRLKEFSLISGATFFKVFPFSLVFNEDMTVLYVGETLLRLYGSMPIIGENITQKFVLRRPQMDFTYGNVLCLQKVVFELESMTPLKKLSCSLVCRHKSCDCSGEREEATRTLLLKGEMKYISDLGGIAFLCAPLLGSMGEMEETGLFIHDLNMYDSSRDMIMAGWQHASRLEYSIEKQIEKSKQISDTMKKLDEWRVKSETLLYSMIPRQIAVRLKNGEDPVNTCEVFKQVTIMFSYLIGFNELCAEISAMDLVEYINSIFIVFDAVVDKHDVFKVETLGDAVYMVAGGVPDRRPNHAQSVAQVTLELIDKVKNIKHPLGGRKTLQIRIGMHTGSVVAGVVGKRMPQYCLFGDTVNTASRMQTYSEAGRIHVSEPCHECLKKCPDFVTVFRGRVNIKGKGQMNTYWLAGYKDDPEIERIRADLRQEQAKAMTEKATRLSVTDLSDGFNLRRFRKQSEICLFELGLQAQRRASKGSQPSSGLGSPVSSRADLKAFEPGTPGTPGTQRGSDSSLNQMMLPSIGTAISQAELRMALERSAISLDQFENPGRKFSVGSEDSDIICFDAHSEMSTDSLCNSAPGSPPKVVIDPAPVCSFSPAGSPKTTRKRLPGMRRAGVFTCPSLDFIKEKSPNPCEETSPALAKTPLTAVEVLCNSNGASNSKDNPSRRSEVPKFVFPAKDACSDATEFLPQQRDSEKETKTVPLKVADTKENKGNDIDSAGNRKQSVPEIRVDGVNSEEKQHLKDNTTTSSIRRHSGSEERTPRENTDANKRDSGYISADCPMLSLGASLTVPGVSELPAAEAEKSAGPTKRNSTTPSNCDSSHLATKDDKDDKGKVCDISIPLEIPRVSSVRTEEDVISRAAEALSSSWNQSCEALDQNSDSELSEEGLSLPDHLSPAGPQSRRGSSVSVIDNTATELQFTQHYCEQHTSKENSLPDDKKPLHFFLPNDGNGEDSKPVLSSASDLKDERVKDNKTSVDKATSATPVAINDLQALSDSIKVRNPLLNLSKFRLRHSIDLGVSKEKEATGLINGWCESQEDLCPQPRLRSNTLASKTVIRKPSLDLGPIVRCESASANLESLLDDCECPIQQPKQQADLEKNLISFESNLSLNQARLYTIHDACFRRSTILDQSLEDLHFKRSGIKPLLGRNKRTRQSSVGSIDIDVPLGELAEDSSGQNEMASDDFNKCSSCACDSKILRSPPAECLVEHSS